MARNGSTLSFLSNNRLEADPLATQAIFYMLPTCSVHLVMQSAGLLDKKVYPFRKFTFFTSPV